mgnify:CR=1 FL=1
MSEIDINTYYQDIETGDLNLEEQHTLGASYSSYIAQP